MSQPRWNRYDRSLNVALDHVESQLRWRASIRGPRKATRLAAFEKGLVRWIEETYDPDTYVPAQGHWFSE